MGVAGGEGVRPEISFKFIPPNDRRKNRKRGKEKF